MIASRTRLWMAAVALALAPLAALADGVAVRFDPTDPAANPFPSDRLTVRDWRNTTYRRVSLPKPDCSVRPTDCADIDVINTLDGFSTQPRITVPFTGDIDVASVNSHTVFLLNLGDTQTLRGFGQRVGINQVLWDVASKTLVFEPDALLAEHSRYVLVVTNGVRDASGKRIKDSDFDEADDDHRGRKFEKQSDRDYRRDLRDAVRAARPGRDKVVAASLFTTQSATSELAQIMRQIKRSMPQAVDFAIGASAAGPVRAVFPVAGLLGIRLNSQISTAPGFTTTFLPTPALNVVPGAVAQIAYGTYRSPNYQTAERFIPAAGTLSGTPQVQGSNTLLFQLFVPAGVKPAGGWPVALLGHGFTDSMYGAPWAVASVLASQGIATLSINVVGHGGGSLGTLDVLPAGGGTPVVLTAGGRGIDVDGNTAIDSTEGVNAAPPRDIIGSRDGLRQTAIDLMQLVRQIEVGIDVDGDGSADLNAHRIYYAGQSFGGIYGTILLGVEPNIKAGVPNVPGGSITEVARLGAFRVLTAHCAGRAPAAAAEPAAHAGRAVPVQPGLQREHAAAQSAACDQQRARRDRHCPGAGPLRVGAAGRQPGVVCAADPQAAAAGPRGQAGHRAVCQGRRHRAQSRPPVPCCAPVNCRTGPPTSATTWCSPPTRRAPSRRTRTPS